MNYCIRLLLFSGTLALCVLMTTQLLAGTVIGIMQMKDGTPMSGGKVIIFDGDKGPAPRYAEDYREPDLVLDLNNEGAFEARLEAGRYYFGALQWVDGRGPGRPVTGDNFFLMRDHLVKVPAKGLVDLGTIQQGEMIQ